MKLKELKAFLNSLSANELEGDLQYKSDDYGLSGVITGIEKANQNFYYTGDDDPCPLYTKRQLIEDRGHDEEEIDEMVVEIAKGSYFISLDKKIK